MILFAGRKIAVAIHVKGSPPMFTSLKRRASRVVVAVAFAGTALIGAANTATAATLPATGFTPINGVARIELRPANDLNQVLKIDDGFANQQSLIAIISAGATTLQEKAMTFTVQPSGAITITNSASGTRCLEPTPDNLLVHAVTCNGSAKQTWLVQRRPGGHHVKNLATGTVMAPGCGPLGCLPSMEAPESSNTGLATQSWKIANV